MRASVSTVLASLLMLAMILVIWSRGAQAGIVALEDALELRAADATWAGLPAGRLAVRACPECSPRVFVVDGNTRFLVTGRGELDLREFLRACDSDAGRRGLAYVYFVPGSDRLRRVRLAPRYSAGEAP